LRRNRSRHKHIKFDLNRRSSQTIPVTTESNIVKTNQKSIDKVISFKDKSESLSWGKADEHTPSDVVHEVNSGYINKCIQDIKEYYKDDQVVHDKSESSMSSNFHMEVKVNNDAGNFN
jgi:hypothetical protein